MTENKSSNNQKSFTDFLAKREQEFQNSLQTKFVSRNNLNNQIAKLTQQLEQQEDEILVISGSLKEVQFLINTLQTNTENSKNG